MDRIRLIFLVIGSLFLGSGAIWAGWLKWSSEKSMSGVLYIIAAAVIITMCVLVFVHGQRSGKQ